MSKDKKGLVYALIVFILIMVVLSNLENIFGNETLGAVVVAVILFGGGILVLRG